ncbi:MAG: hypothetical protein NTY54_04335 [Actinobacteria bacterium]|nr:hypothetical protein [Actinomycetota bacterium]
MKKFLLVVAVLFGFLPASLAKAHDPIILTSDQRTPSDGPLLLDGTISFALYGSLDTAGDTRGFRVKFNAGDPLYLSILIPDLAPENTLDDASLPFLNVEDPSGAILNFATTEKISFAEPFTGTNYVRLTEFNTTALGGTYSITVAGDSPARFTISVGKKEMFGTPVENITNRELGVAGVMAWYAGESLTVASTVPIALPKNVPTSEPDSETSLGESSSNNQLILIIAAIAVIVVLGFVRVAKTR